MSNAADHANQMIMQGRYDDAAQLLKAHLEHTADDAAAWFVYANLHLAAEFPEHAAAQLMHALRLMPEAVPFHALAGDIALMMGNARAALAAYQNACRLQPGVTENLLKLFSVAILTDRDVTQQMEPNMAAACALPAHMAGLGSIYASAGQFTKAVEAFDRAAAMAQGNEALTYKIESALLTNAPDKVPALLAQYPAALAQLGQQHWIEAQQEFPVTRASLTCAVTTNITKKLVTNKDKAPPKMDLIADTLASWRAAMQPAADTRVLIYFDAPAEDTAESTHYASALQAYCQQYGYELVIKRKNGLKNNVLDALARCETDFFTLLEHDFLFHDCPPQDKVMQALAANPFMHVVQFTRRPITAVRWDTHLWPDPRTAATGMPLLRTPRFSNNPAIIRTAKMRAHFMPIFTGANRFDGTNVGAGGLEEPVKEHVSRLVQHFGFGFAQRWSGYYLYGAHFDAPRLTHTGI